MTALAPPRSAARDVRLGGTWTVRQSVKNAGIALSARAALAATDRIPARVLLALGSALGRLVAVCWSAGRRAAAVSTARCLPEAAARSAARACFANAGENLARTLLLRRSDVVAQADVEVPPEDRATLDRALARGRGVVFVSAHLGPFEHLAAVVAELGYEPAIVVRESYDPRLDPLVDRHRVARGIEVIHRGRAGAAVRIVRALRQGRPVGFLPDFGGRVPKVAASFLGTEAGFPVGPQQIATRVGAAVVVGVLHPRDGAPAGAGEPAFRLSIREVATEGTPVELTRRVARALEAAILATDASASHFPWMALTEERDGGDADRRG